MRIRDVRPVLFSGGSRNMLVVVVETDDGLLGFGEGGMSSHLPAVAAAVEKSGEVVRVVIVRRDPALTKEQVIEHCRKELTGYKVPKIVEFWKELPKTNVGKVLRREVKNAQQKAPVAA